MQATKEKARVMAGRSLLRNKSRAQVDGLRISVEVLQQALVELIRRHRVQDLRLDLFGALAEVVLQIAFLVVIQRFDQGNEKCFLRQDLAFHRPQLGALIA
ncbi:MAG: hypothetical protein AB7U71_08790 [Comamonas sp.]